MNPTRLIKKTILIPVLLACVSGCRCDKDDDDSYIDGERQLSDSGTYVLTLSNDDGAVELGHNTFILRVEAADPAVPIEEGVAVSDAEVSLHAHMPLQGDIEPIDVTGSYVGDGEYVFEGLAVEQSGLWQLDFAVVGQRADTVSFGFELED